MYFIGFTEYINAYLFLSWSISLYHHTNLELIEIVQKLVLQFSLLVNHVTSADHGHGLQTRN